MNFAYSSSTSRTIIKLCQFGKPRNARISRKWCAFFRVANQFLLPFRAVFQIRMTQIFREFGQIPAYFDAVKAGPNLSAADFINRSMFSTSIVFVKDRLLQYFHQVVFGACGLLVSRTHQKRFSGRMLLVQGRRVSWKFDDLLPFFAKLVSEDSFLLHLWDFAPNQLPAIVCLRERGKASRKIFKTSFAVRVVFPAILSQCAISCGSRILFFPHHHSVNAYHLFNCRGVVVISISGARLKFSLGNG